MMIIFIYEHIARNNEHSIYWIGAKVDIRLNLRRISLARYTIVPLAHRREHNPENNTQLDQKKDSLSGIPDDL